MLRNYTPSLLAVVLLLLSSACSTSASQPAAVDQETQKAIQTKLKQLVGTSPDFQARNMFVDWVSEGQTIIRKQLDAILPTVRIHGTIPPDELNKDDPYWVAQYRGAAALYMYDEQKRPEQHMVLQIDDKLYDVSASARNVNILLQWVTQQTKY